MENHYPPHIWRIIHTVRGARVGKDCVYRVHDRLIDRYSNLWIDCSSSHSSGVWQGQRRTCGELNSNLHPCLGPFRLRRGGISRIPQALHLRRK